MYGDFKRFGIQLSAVYDTAFLFRELGISIGYD